MIESTARAERVNLQNLSSPAYTWEVPEKPVCVRMPLNVIDRLEKEVVENFRSLTSRGSEIGGILLGAVGPGSPSIVTIEDYEAIPCDYSRGPLYRLSDADMGRFERAIEQRLSGGGFRVVGFFRSHTRKGLSLDAEDLSFFCARFRDPHHIALLVRPFATKASTAGFFIWENGTVQGEASYLEFPFRSSQLSPSAGTSTADALPAAPTPAVSPAAAPPPPAPAVPKPATRAQIVPIASRREVTLPPPPEPAETKQPEAKAPAPPPAQTRPAAQTPTQTRPAPSSVAAPPSAAKSPSATAAPAPPAKPASAPAAPAPAAKTSASPAAPAPSAPARPAAAPAPAAEKEKESDKSKEADKSKEKAAAAPAPAKRPDWDKSKDKPKAAEPAKVQEAQKPDAKTEAKPEGKSEPKEKKAAAAQESAAEPSSARGKTIMFGMIALAALAAIMVLFVYPGVLRHVGSTPAATADLASLSLRVERTGTDVLLTWNRDSSAIQKAQHAVLTISDGDRHENYDMDVSQLRNGSIVYSPLTADVSFKMEVTGANNAKTASESVRVLRTRPSPMPDGSQPPADTTTAKSNPKPGQPPTAAAPASSPASAPPSSEPAAQEEAPVASKAGAPVKPFNTASLVQRLRPATPSDVPLPDAPVLTNIPVAPTAAPSFGSTIAPPPSRPPAAASTTPSVPAPPPTAGDRRPPAGGQITQAQVLVSKQPEYPKLARQMGVKGAVELVATIGTDGRVKKVKIEKGHPLLQKAASDAVMQWVYRPTLLNGVPVENDTHITLNFMGDK